MGTQRVSMEGLIDYSIRGCILKEYTFIYLPHIEGLKGNLTEDSTPDLNSLSGGAIAELLSTTISPNKAEVLNSLGSSLSFMDFNKLNLNNLKTIPIYLESILYNLRIKRNF